MIATKPIRGTPPNVRRMAIELRHNMTHAEKILWEQLRNRNLSGFKFRRQARSGHLSPIFTVLKSGWWSNWMAVSTLNK